MNEAKFEKARESQASAEEMRQRRAKYEEWQRSVRADDVDRRREAKAKEENLKKP